MFLNENNNLVNVLKVNESKERCMAILTISSSEDSQEFNFKLCEKLASELKSFGFGCYIAQGHYYEKIKGVEQTIERKDYNLVVIGCKADEELLKKLIIKLSQDYKLDSVLFKSCLGKVIVYDSDGKVKNLLGKFHANRILKYMQKFKQNSSYGLDNISDFKDGYASSFLGAVRRHQKIEDLLSEGKPFINIFKEIELQENCMAILTSPKPLNQEEENQRLNQELSDYLSKYGFGFREAKGHYTRRVDEIKGISNFIEDYALVISGKESEDLLECP